MSHVGLLGRLCLGVALSVVQVSASSSSDSLQTSNWWKTVRSALLQVQSSPVAESPVWDHESNQAEALLGFSVASAGDVNNDGFDDVVVGLPFYSNGQDEEGAVFVFHGSASGLPTTPTLVLEINKVGAQFGRSVASAGDVNNDDYDDVIVGAPFFSTTTFPNRGRVYVYYGSASGLPSTHDWDKLGNKQNDFFGHSVASAGNINNDDYDDVIVGAIGVDEDPGQTGTLAEAGAAYVYLGSGSGLSVGANWIERGSQANAFFGHSVASAGDVNNDGFDEVIVGAPFHGSSPASGGGAFVFQGSSTGVLDPIYWSDNGTQTGALFGQSVASAGDVNNDTFDDVIVGAPLWSDPNDNLSQEGGAFVYYGSGSGLSSTPDWTVDADQSFAQLGWSVAGGRDLNQDNIDDVVVGSPKYDADIEDEGAAFLWFGSNGGLPANPAPATADRGLAGRVQGSQFGFSVAPAGDVDNDNAQDLIVGLPEYSDGETEEGGGQVYSGRACAAGIKIVTGWNLLSVPCELSDMGVSSVFPNAISSAFAFGESGYEVQTTLETGKGYWIRFGADEIVSILGDPPSPSEFSVLEGWNLVGGFGYVSPRDDLSPALGVNFLSDFFGFGEAGYRSSDALEPGQGYWIRVNVDGTITVP